MKKLQRKMNMIDWAGNGRVGRAEALRLARVRKYRGWRRLGGLVGRGCGARKTLVWLGSGW